MKKQKNKKLKAIFLTISLLLTAYLFVDIDVNSAGSGDSGELPSFLYGPPNIDYNYIWTKTQDLGDIINLSQSEDRGREFGMWGENEAADWIQTYMNSSELNLSATLEKIDSYWSNSDSWSPKKDKYCGPLDVKRNFSNDDYYLNVTIWDKDGNGGLIYNDSRNMTCFPLLKGGLGGHAQQVFQQPQYCSFGNSI